MRIWTLHPKYLDSRGLVALWRETLLAQAVLRNQTRGYTQHPQLRRFRAADDPLAAISAYLREVQAEATRRGYAFDASKIGDAPAAEVLPATQGQLDYEWMHLKRKLAVRAPEVLMSIETIATPAPHPLFRIEAGGVADWEVVS